ncbi:PREDICTED: SH3 domain-containing YSC84-like protein 1 [Priapulus caudatus]|uniref:SH3 domain-containing YSC84-like protein 1 n=1 Tax=Priapulus caudatus TaxID=37621 RepID=A0ABM1F0Z1_PRICU|nr:PREDICTED: SH3 domain-containing YSC84-like protein 1 [Priapulus caudatus]
MQMVVNNPFPTSLKSESKKAAKILEDFTMPSVGKGVDQIIPAGIIAKARGIAILTVVKASFWLSIRGGSGDVIAKLKSDSTGSGEIGIRYSSITDERNPHSNWSVTDFVIILSNQSAVDAFSLGGNVTLGRNLTVAVGPLGRNVEGDVALRNTAAVYTYSRSKDLFLGISLEGSMLVERKDCNEKFYHRKIRSREILVGGVDVPAEAEVLYAAIDSHMTTAEQYVVSEAKRRAKKGSAKIRRQCFLQDAETESNTALVVRAVSDFTGQMPYDLSFRRRGNLINLLTQTQYDFDWWEAELHGRIGTFPANYVKPL